MLFSVQEEILRYFLSVSPPPSVQNEAQTSSLSLSPGSDPGPCAVLCWEDVTV